MGLCYFGASGICPWCVTPPAPGSYNGLGKHISIISTLFCIIKPMRAHLTMELAESCVLTAKWSLLQLLRGAGFYSLNVKLESRLGDGNEMYVNEMQI